MAENIDLPKHEPYSLGTAHRASAQAVSSTVEMTLHVNLRGAQQPVTIVVRMAQNVANRLGRDLMENAREVEMRKSQEPTLQPLAHHLHS